jgi:hypothetical protein
MIAPPAEKLTSRAAVTLLESLSVIELVVVEGEQPSAGVLQPAIHVTSRVWAVTGEETVTMIGPLARNTTSVPAVTGAFVVTWIAPPFAVSVTFPLVAATDVVAHSGELAGDSSDTVIPPPAVKLTLSTASTFAVL